MATDATPINLPADGTWVAVGPAGYGSRFFMITGNTGVRFAHKATQPAIDENIGAAFQPGWKDTIGNDDPLAILWACTDAQGRMAWLRTLA